MSYDLDLTNLPLTDPRVAFVEAKPAGWAGDLQIQKLYQALKDHDIPSSVWPQSPSDNKCLERAIHSLRGQRSLVRPLAKGRGWSLILESADNLDLEKLGNDGREAHNVELTCKVERGEFDSALSSVRVTPNDHPAVPLIKQEFERYRGDTEDNGLFKCSQDLSVWFSQTIVPWCRGVSTRSRGGSYYIMKGTYLDRMMRVTSALAQASDVDAHTLQVSGKPIQIHKVRLGGRIILKPEIATTTAVEIMIDNIISECDKVCDQLDEDLQGDKLGLRGLASRKSSAEDTLRKLKEYEELLGTNLDDVRSRLEEVKAGLGMAELRVLAEK
jgi:hypothetical protein